MRRMALASLPLAVTGGLTACSDSESPSRHRPGRTRPRLPRPPRLDRRRRARPPVGRQADRPRPAAGHRARPGAAVARHHGKRRTVAFPSSQVWVSGETGLLGMAVDPAFGQNHRIYLCQGGTLRNGSHDVHVTAWRLSVGPAEGHPDQDARRWLPHEQRTPRRVPTADRAQRRPDRRHRRRRDRDQPARPHVVRREDAAAGPVHRRALAGQPLGRRRRTARSATSTPGATATSRAWPSAPTARCGRSSTDPTATTR